MCEAMSSGLVPIASLNTAIPEFVADGETGFLCDGPDEIASAIVQVAKSPELFQRMSASASNAIRRKAGSDVVIPAELSLMQGLVSA